MTSPHRMTPERLARARAHWDQEHLTRKIAEAKQEQQKLDPLVSAVGEVLIALEGYKVWDLDQSDPVRLWYVEGRFIRDLLLTEREALQAQATSAERDLRLLTRWVHKPQEEPAPQEGGSSGEGLPPSGQ